MNRQLDDLRLEGRALRSRLEQLVVADESVPTWVGDVRAWQFDCLAIVAAQRPDHLAGFREEVHAIQGPAEPGVATAGSLIRLDQSLASWLLVIDWLRRLD